MSDRKIELKILNVSKGRFPNSAFNVILEELENKKTFEIIIGFFEANAIAIALENQTSQRPMTHDLLLNVIDELKGEVVEVIIKRLHEGVFYSIILLEHNGYVHEIDSRTSDALAIAIRVGCPIYMNKSLLAQVIPLSSNIDTIKINIEVALNNNDDTNENDFYGMDNTELKDKLAQLLEDEDYEKAAQARDEMIRRGL